jgi:hypothetical protein
MTRSSRLIKSSFISQQKDANILLLQMTTKESTRKGQETSVQLKEIQTRTTLAGNSIITT